MSAMIVQLRPRPPRSPRPRPEERDRRPGRARGSALGRARGPVGSEAHGVARRSARRLVTTVRAPRTWAPRIPRGDRGDVPGWVLVTMMTAGLVFVLWGLAGQELQNLFTSSLSKVSGKL